MSNQNQKSNKSAGREFAFQYLYHLQLKSSKEVLNQLIENNEDISAHIESELPNYRESISVELDKGTLFFAVQLIQGSLRNYKEISEIIDNFSTKKNRISKIDFTILLQSVFELLHIEGTPARVVLNESIEIAKKFGNENSKTFINGILDSIASEHGRK